MCLECKLGSAGRGVGARSRTTVAAMRGIPSWHADLRARFQELKAGVVEATQPEEPSDDELHHVDLERRRELTKARRKAEVARIQDELDAISPEVFALTREAMRRTLGMRHFDVQ